MIHDQEFKHQVCPQQIFGSPKTGQVWQLAAIPIPKDLIHRQVWAITSTSGIGFGYEFTYLLQFWNGVLPSYAPGQPTFSPLGELVLSIPIFKGRKVAGSETEHHSWVNQNNMQLFTGGPMINYGTNNNGFLSSGKNFDLKVAADFAVITMEGNNGGANWASNAWLGIISSRFAALPYHERNFQPDFL